MDTPQQAKALRHGGCSFVTKLLAKAEMITQANVDSLESVSTEDRASIDLILSQFVAKKLKLEELDHAIAAAKTVEQDFRR